MGGQWTWPRPGSLPVHAGTLDLADQLVAGRQARLVDHLLEPLDIGCASFRRPLRRCRAASGELFASSAARDDSISTSRCLPRASSRATAAGGYSPLM